MADVFVRHERCKVQTAPVVPADVAEQSCHSGGLVFPVWPEPCNGDRKIGIGLLVHTCAFIRPANFSLTFLTFGATTNMQ
jgi:hypothetical protein